MARPPQRQVQDADLMDSGGSDDGGFPDELSFDSNDDDAGSGGEPGQREQVPQSFDPQAAFQQLQTQVSQLARENELLRRAIPPAGAPRQQEARPAAQEIDWDQEFYQSPGAAINKAMAITKAQTEHELTSKYQREQSTRNFWDEFYRANPRLRDARDLVEKTMEKHLNELSPMAVPDAMQKLATLTQDRIGQLTQSGAQRKRVSVEGGGAPLPVQRNAPAAENVTTLSDLIRARRKKHSA